MKNCPLLFQNSFPFFISILQGTLVSLLWKRKTLFSLFSLHWKSNLENLRKKCTVLDAFSQGETIASNDEKSFWQKNILHFCNVPTTIQSLKHVLQQKSLDETKASGYTGLLMLPVLILAQHGVSAVYFQLWLLFPEYQKAYGSIYSSILSPLPFSCILHHSFHMLLIFLNFS